MKFCDKLKELRKQNNLTQDELAEKLFVTRNAISKWENDKGYPNIESLKLIAKYFNLTLDALLNEEDVKIMTLENKQLLEQKNSVIYHLVIFLIYSAIGIGMPDLIFWYDPTAGFFYFVCLAPISFAIVGLIAGFLSNKWKQVLFVAILAILPIYVYFDFFHNVHLGIWQFLYYVVFVGVYFLTRYLVNRQYSPKMMNIGLYTTLGFLLGTIFLFVMLTIVGIISIEKNHGSAPWYTPLVAYGCVFILPLMIETVFLLFFKRRIKMQKGE